LVTVRNALFLIKTYTTSAFPNIPVTNITIKIMGTTRTAITSFSESFIVDQFSYEKLEGPNKDSFSFISACKPDISVAKLLTICRVISIAESSSL
jgi:hypothetical protein